MRLANAKEWAAANGIVTGAADPIALAAASVRAPSTRGHRTVRGLGEGLASELLAGRWDLERRPRHTPLVPAERSEEGYIERLAWYRSWHVDPPDAWGIYIGD